MGEARAVATSWLGVCPDPGPAANHGLLLWPLADLEPLPRARLAHGCISGTSTPEFTVGPWGGRWLSGREASFEALDLTASAPVAWGTASVWWRLPATPGTSVPPLRAGGPRPQAVPSNAALSEQRPTGWGSSVSTCFPGGGGGTTQLPGTHGAPRAGVGWRACELTPSPLLHRHPSGLPSRGPGCWCLRWGPCSEWPCCLLTSGRGLLGKHHGCWRAGGPGGPASTSILMERRPIWGQGVWDQVGRWSWLRGTPHILQGRPPPPAPTLAGLRALKKHFTLVHVYFETLAYSQEVAQAAHRGPVWPHPVPRAMGQH